ncbi:antibiotic biosynthesis monooxygenase [Microcoleus sp. FACHB-831]|nr:antibiotic biosynthesis monooxygenase [Microcoleus sp. FACHB-831]
MSETTVRVVARVVALPDKVEQVKSILLHIIEPTRQEQGCISYELLQNQQEPRDFTFVEEWENDALLQVHLASAHIHEAGKKLNGLVVGEPDIRIYRLIK